MTDIVGTVTQPVTFLACLGAGVAAALIYCFCYLVRYFAKNRKAVELATDLFFMLSAATLYLTALFFSGFGEIRLYTILGFLIGFFLLYFLLRPLKKTAPLLYARLQKLKKLPVLRKIFK